VCLDDQRVPFARHVIPRLVEPPNQNPPLCIFPLVEVNPGELHTREPGIRIP